MLQQINHVLAKIEKSIADTICSPLIIILSKDLPVQRARTKNPQLYLDVFNESYDRNNRVNSCSKYYIYFGVINRND